MSLKGAVSKKSHTNEVALKSKKALSEHPEKRLNCVVPEPDLKALKAKAAQEGITIRELVNQWITQYIKD